METKHNSILSGRMVKGIIIVISIIIIILVTIILIIHSYINKMDLISAANAKSRAAMQNDQASVVTEDTDTSLPDSPGNEINSLEEAIRKNMEERSSQILSDKNVSNILLVGSDTRAKDGSGRSDVIILVSINKKTKEIVMTSFLRDIYLKIPGRDNNRINAAFAFGGSELLMDTMEQNFNIKVDKFASIDFYSFIDIVDAIGGVTIDVSSDEIPVMNHYLAEINRLTGQKKGTDYITKAGNLLLNGRQALAFSRNRYVGNGDFSRTERQRRVLEQIYKKVKDLNIVQMKKLFDIVLPKITTNLSEGQIFSLILSMPAYMKYDIKQWSIPKADSFKYMRIRGMAVLGLDFEENIKEISKRIYGINAK